MTTLDMHWEDEDSLNALIQKIPYAKFIGFQARIEGEVITTRLAFRERLIGNPVLPAIHGGIIGAFLEMTALVQLMAQIECAALPKTVDITIDYLRTGRPQDVFARAHITKHGRRVANVRAEAWQTGPDRPIATLHGHFLLKPKNHSAS